MRQAAKVSPKVIMRDWMEPMKPHRPWLLSKDGS
jgi:hypothetical protein